MQYQFELMPQLTCISSLLILKNCKSKLQTSRHTVLHLQVGAVHLYFISPAWGLPQNLERQGLEPLWVMCQVELLVKLSFQSVDKFQLINSSVDWIWIRREKSSLIITPVFLCFPLYISHKRTVWKDTVAWICVNVHIHFSSGDTFDAVVSWPTAITK